MTRLPATALTLGAALMLNAAGCSKVDKPRLTAQEAAEAERKAAPAAPAPAPPPKPEKKAEPAKPAPVVEVRHVPADPTKWQLADLQAGLSNHDIRFIPAVVFFGLHANDAQHANELKALLEAAGKMKDDPNPLLPLPATPVATTAGTPPTTIQVLPLPGTTAPGKQTPPTGRRPRRMGGAFGGGK